MAWFKIDDQLSGHPKARRAGLAAMGLWVTAGAYTSGYRLDGFVPAHYVTSWRDGRKLANQLVAAGLWEPATHPDEGAGWRFHDYGDYNMTVAAWEADKAAARDRKQRERSRRRDGNVTPLKAGDGT